MLWEGRRLRDVTEADLRQVIDSGLAEHLQLEYKSELYSSNDRGNRESLLDVCMFANAEGGILLIGVPEQRDPEGQPTGMPDRGAALGINIANPEATLQSLDARVTASIEERLQLESAAIRLADGSHVLALRIPNSPSKPHCVRYQGHVYFPSRRERSRYEMDVREIKELVLRTSSRLAQSEQTLQTIFLKAPQVDGEPYLHIGIIPVFWKDFLVNVTAPNIRQAVALFDVLNDPPQVAGLTYVFEGLERRAPNRNIAQLRRTGLLSFRWQLAGGRHAGFWFYPTAIDLQLRKFVVRARALYGVTEVSGPYLLSMMLRTPVPLAARYGAVVPHEYNQTDPITPGDYAFPAMLVDDLSDPDRIIRPFCDQAHQTFGRAASPCFDVDGLWVGIGRD